MKQRYRVMAGLVIGLMMGMVVASAGAQGEAVVVTRNETVVDFPEEVVFELEVSGEVAEAALVYTVDKFSCLEAETRVPVEVTGGMVSWTWVMGRSGNPPPGAGLAWQWELTTAMGEVMMTEPQSLIFADERFEWRTLEAEGVQLHWFEGDRVGPTLLDAAVSGLARLENEMGIELQDEVQFFIYDGSEAMREAVLYIQEWAGAVAFQEYNVILMGVPPYLADTWGRDTVQHELAHLVVAQFGRSCVGGRRPNWLEEGLAVYAEGEVNEEVLADIEKGIQENSFEPVRSLNGPFSAHGREAGVAYSQSYSLVAFLLERYGQVAMQDLLQQLAAGSNYDEALLAVYGFDTDGLEAAWRAEIGVAERPFPPTPTPLSAANIPTVVPLVGPVAVPTPAAAANTAPVLPSPGRSVCGFGLVLPLVLWGIWERKRWYQGNRK